MVSFHGYAGDAGVFQWLEDLDGAGEGAGEDLAGMEKVARDQDEINCPINCIGNDACEGVEKVFVTLVLSGGGTVGFAEVDVGGVDEADGHGGPSPNKRFLVARYITPEKRVSKARGQISFSSPLERLEILKSFTNDVKQPCKLSF